MFDITRTEDDDDDDDAKGPAGTVAWLPLPPKRSRATSATGSASCRFGFLEGVKASEMGRAVDEEGAAAW